METVHREVRGRRARGRLAADGLRERPRHEQRADRRQLAQGPWQVLDHPKGDLEVDVVQ